jgi:excisionase family DNA binding protein
MTPAELTEVGHLFRAKLRQLREQERARAPSAKRSPAPRRRDLAALESPPNDDEVLAPTDVARLLNVHPKTVTRWAGNNDGLPSFRTVGGHRRFRWADVKRWLNRAGAAAP